MNGIVGKARKLVPAGVWLLLLAVWAIHFFAVWAWFDRTVIPTRTLHNNYATQAVYAMVLSGHSRLEKPTPHTAIQLPPTDKGVGALATLRSAISSPLQPAQYGTTVCLFSVLSSLPAVLLGIDPMTLQVGTVMPIGLLLIAMYSIARRFTTPGTAAAAAILLTLFPVTIGAMRTAQPWLGLMLGPATAIAALLATDRFRRLVWVVPAALLTTLATRWGESASDALKALFAISGVVAALGGSLLVHRTERWGRGYFGLGLYVVVVTLTIDDDWLRTQCLRFVGPEALGDGSTPLLELLRHGILAFFGYAWLCRRMMLGWPAAIVVLVGAVSLVRAWPRKDADWRVNMTAVILWCVTPLFLLSLSEKTNAEYIIGTVPPLAIVAAVGCREAPRIGPWLPWVALLLLVPTYVALHSPALLRTNRNGDAPLVVRYGLAVETCNPPASEHTWHGVVSGALVRFTDYETNPSENDRHTLEARRWICEGEGAATFEAMPPGSIVLALITGEGPFDWIGGVIQAQHPHVVIRTPMVREDGTFVVAPGMDITQYISAWDNTYVATFRRYYVREGPPPVGPQPPPSEVGEVVEIARSEQIVLYRVLQPTTRAVLP